MTRAAILLLLASTFVFTTLGLASIVPVEPPAGTVPDYAGVPLEVISGPVTLEVVDGGEEGWCPGAIELAEVCLPQAANAVANTP